MTYGSISNHLFAIKLLYDECRDHMSVAMQNWRCVPDCTHLFLLSVDAKALSSNRQIDSTLMGTTIENFKGYKMR